MSLKYNEKLEVFIDQNEDELMSIWDEYKYDKLCGEYFHHDDVDYWNEELFNDMCGDIHYDLENKIKLKLIK